MMDSKLDALPHDIEGILSYPWSYYSDYGLYALLVILILLALFLPRWMKKSKQDANITHINENSLEILLKNIRNLSQKSGPEYFFGVSFLFREFLDAVDDLGTKHQTTREIFAQLERRSAFTYHEVGEIKALLSELDRIRFSGEPMESVNITAFQQRILPLVDSIHASYQKRLALARAGEELKAEASR